MAKPNSDADDNKNVDDDPKEVSGVAPTLDQVHSMNQRKVEEEDATNEGDTSDTGDADDTDGAAGTDESDVADGGESEDDDAASDDAGGEDDAAVDDDAGGTSDGTPAADETPAAAVDQPAPDLDTSKPGEGKIAIKDAEGKTFYFNNRGEMPDDFEPASYKALMDAASEFAKKELNDEATARAADAKATADAEAAETKARTDAMQTEWERDASDLSSAGFLPKDPKKLEAAKTEVYDYIEAELKKGNVISNFKQAYKAMMYDRDQATKADEQKKIDQAKKDRGSIVQGGSSSGAPAGGATRGKVIEAPPTGVGLDAVHNRAVESLNP